MLLIGKKICFALTGSNSVIEKTIPQISRLVEQGVEIIPVLSFNVFNEKIINKLQKITIKEVIDTIEKAENIEKFDDIDLMVIAPCSRKYNRENCKWNNRYS